MIQRHILAESNHYQVSHEYELVFLRCKSGLFATSKSEIVIGDFYGDPAAAIIDEKERFVIMVGCGMIIYNLSEPFEPYQYDLPSSQWRELFREPKNSWWIESIIQTSENTFHFTVDPNSNEVGVYELTLPDLAIQRAR
jgi:hypothetical protein